MESHNLLIKELIDSSGGLHLSLYLKNDEHVVQRLTAELDDIEAALELEHGAAFVEAFLEPIFDRAEILRERFSGYPTIVIMRKDDFIKLVGLPGEHGTFHVLSKTFHVKPLLSWRQTQFYGTLVYCTKDRVQLISVSTNSVKKIVEISSNMYLSDAQSLKAVKKDQSLYNQHNLIYWLKLIFENKKLTLPDPVLVYGYPSTAEFCVDAIGRLKNREVLRAEFTLKPSLRKAVKWAGPRFKEESLIELEKLQQSFLQPGRDEIVSANWNEIIQGIRQGRVRSIMIASDVAVFGKINEKDNSFEITHTHSDTEDDDILDDIAQMALKSGAKVLFYEASTLPENKRSLIKAVLCMEEGYSSSSPQDGAA